MSTQSQSDDSPGPSQRDHYRRGRRSTTRSTRASNSTATDRSRSPHPSAQDTASDSSPTAVPARNFRRTRSSLADTSSNSDRSSLGQSQPRRPARNSRRQPQHSDTSSFGTPTGGSDTSNQGHSSAAQELDSESDTEIYNPPDNMNVDTTDDEVGRPVRPEEDDDVIHIPQVIEVIDLCTQQPIVARRNPVPILNEVIEIFDSPLVERARSVRVRDGNQFAVPNARTPPAASSNRRQVLDLDNTMDTSSQALNVKIQCPICLDGVSGKNPVSTVCGHIYCERCLTNALLNEKKCPMCKKPLRTKRDYHRIFI